MNSLIFQPDTLNIFCDASIIKKPQGPNGERFYIGCPGAICVKTFEGQEPQVVDCRIDVFDNATNNYSEIYAILMGLHLASPAKTINLFSDSQISIFGIREWIFNWVKTMGKDKTMYGSSGNPVANQDVFLHIFRYIVSNNLNINFLHQYGHVNVNKQKQVQDAMVAFKAFNGFNIPVDDMIKISNYNNYIDQLTKDVLKTNLNNIQNSIKSMVSYVPDGNAVQSYKSLINKK